MYGGANPPYPDPNNVGFQMPQEPQNYGQQPGFPPNAQMHPMGGGFGQAPPMSQPPMNPYSQQQQPYQPQPPVGGYPQQPLYNPQTYPQAS